MSLTLAVLSWVSDVIMPSAYTTVAATVTLVDRWLENTLNLTCCV